MTDLVAGYAPDVPILRGMSLSVHTGEIVTVLGPNGAGKSTLIKAIAGLVPTSSGAIRVRGNNIMGLATHRLVAAGVAYVPQIDNIFTRLSVQENLEIGGMAAPSELRHRIAEIYALFPDLARLRQLAAGKLSGGQRQMVAVARALMARPHLIMLDEPSEGIMPVLVDEMFELFSAMKAEGTTILLVEQNVELALAIADHAYVLDQGTIVHHDTGKALLADADIQERYCSV